ncbi:MAG: hypothetical protein ACYC35_28195 [Pirellulales bacterium]
MIDFARHSHPDPKPPKDEPPVLTVSGLILCDPETREPAAVLSVKREGGKPALVFIDPSTGRPRMAIGLADEGPGCIVLYDQAGATRLTIALTPTGSPVVLAFDGQGNPMRFVADSEGPQATNPEKNNS